MIDRDYASQYRKSDEEEVQSDNHEHLCKTLNQISLSFGRPIRALDLGCGTGRYFHCFHNVARLTALDGSIDMLNEARDPVRRERMNIGGVDLICANVLELPIRMQFELIYSIGVFGELIPWDVPICTRLFDALTPGGKLFFTVVDVFSKYPYMTHKRRIAETVNLALPPLWKRKLRERLGTCYMSKYELIRIFKKSKFGKFEIVRHVSTARFWKGAHYNCTATKLL